MKTAQHVYRSHGFTEIEEYRDSEVPDPLKPYWLFIEKKL